MGGITPNTEKKTFFWIKKVFLQLIRLVPVGQAVAADNV